MQKKSRILSNLIRNYDTTTSNRLITLLSDFGLNDVYVGVMKGVIARINPTLTIVDLTHEISPQNIQASPAGALFA